MSAISWSRSCKSSPTSRTRSRSWPTRPFPKTSRTDVSGDHIVIVGAGHAGGCAASGLRAAGHTGPVTLLGVEQHPPYERPPLSKELLQGAVAVEKTYLRPASWYPEHDVDLRLG